MNALIITFSVVATHTSNLIQTPRRTSCSCLYTVTFSPALLIASPKFAAMFAPLLRLILTASVFHSCSIRHSRFPPTVFSRKDLKSAVDDCLELSPQGNCSTEVYGPIEDWDVSRVTNMEQMFKSASWFNADLSKWDVSRVINMEQMFKGASWFNTDLSKWDVSRVTNMEQMFQNASWFNADLSKWDVSRVTNMHLMFSGARSFNHKLCSEAWVKSVSSVETRKTIFANSRGSISKSTCG